MWARFSERFCHKRHLFMFEFLFSMVRTFASAHLLPFLSHRVLLFASSSCVNHTVPHPFSFQGLKTLLLGFIPFIHHRRAFNLLPSFVTIHGNYCLSDFPPCFEDLYPIFKTPLLFFHCK